MENINCKQSVILTERDFSILKSLYDNVVMSFSQIAKMHFAEKAKPTVANRLSKLERSAFVQKFKVPRLETYAQQSQISVVYQISRLGILALQKRFLDFEFRPEPIRLKPLSLDHDLLLVDVLAALKIKWPGSKFVNGELYNARTAANQIKPDAIILNANSQSKTALELELSMKSESRYRELILKYRLCKDFDRVLYVTPHKQIETKIKNVIGHGFSEKFQFMELAELLDQGQKPANPLTIRPPGELKERAV